jgi:antirestriction protein ArdC
VSEFGRVGRDGLEVAREARGGPSRRSAMSSSAARARAGRDRTSLYQEITDKIIAELDAGRVPWVQPWGTMAAKASLSMPKNAATQRHYSGINVLILWSAVIERGFGTQNWLTFRQALGLGGNIRKGEHGTTIVYADRFVPDAERRRNGAARIASYSSA